MGFIDELKQKNIEGIRKFPKADLHNHFVLGGSRKYLREHIGENIQAIKKPLHSMITQHQLHQVAEKSITMALPALRMSAVLIVWVGSKKLTPVTSWLI